MDLLKLVLQGVMAIMLGLGMILMDSVLVDTLVLESFGAAVIFCFVSLSSLAILFSTLLTSLSLVTFSRFRFEFSSFNFLLTSCRFNVLFSKL